MQGPVGVWRRHDDAICRFTLIRRRYALIFTSGRQHIGIEKTRLFPSGIDIVFNGVMVVGFEKVLMHSQKRKRETSKIKMDSGSAHMSAKQYRKNIKKRSIILRFFAPKGKE